MSCIEVDLEDYKDEVKHTFCNNNNCLKNDVDRSFKEHFKEYIDDLEKSVYWYKDFNKSPMELIRDLKYLYQEIL